LITKSKANLLFEFLSEIEFRFRPFFIGKFERNTDISQKFNQN